MRARKLSEALKLIMAERGWTQTRLGCELGVSQDWVSTVVRGKRDPGFARATKYLASVGWEVIIGPKREEADPVKRREFLTAAASVAFVPSPKVGLYQDPAYVRELARRIVRARFEHGSGAIAATAIRHTRQIESAVLSRDRKLQEAASELAVETVWTLNDACRVEAGDHVGRLALKLAEASGSPHAQSEAFDALAAIHLDHGDADRALLYARQGVRLRQVPDVQQTWMRLRSGWTLAHVHGQEHAARDEIENVRGLLLDTHDFSGPGKFQWDQTSFSWSQYAQPSLEAADMMGTVALGLSDLGVYGEAQTALNQCVGALEQSSPALASFFLSHQVTAALTAPQLSLAADRMLKLARIAPLVNSPRVDNCVTSVLKQSTKWAGIPKVRNARDQLRANLQKSGRPATSPS